ncbi:MAG: biotin/lipoyl-containing protein [Pseudolysinimonas sp.]|uniref:biotin/lipoyl-containing protein n=1 Tax=Pseudolysinimonas sp. TaxID=2680009 RepID=UPI003C7380AF
MSDVVIPDVGEGGMDIVLSRWFVTAGDWVEPGDDLFELDTAKANVSVQAFASGRVESLTVAEGDEVERGQVVAVLRDGETVGGVSAVSAGPPSAAAGSPKPAAGDPPEAGSPASPRHARPTSPKQKFQANRAQGNNAQPSPVPPSPGRASKEPEPAPLGGAHRRATAASAIASWVQTPHVVATARVGRSWDLNGLISSLAGVLLARPGLGVRWDGIQAIRREEQGIGILWATERGLVQTCITADEAATQTARAVEAAAERGERGRLRPSDHGMRAINVQWIESDAIESVSPVLPSGDSLMLCVVHSRARTLLCLAADQRCIDVDSVAELLDALSAIGEGR